MTARAEGDAAMRLIDPIAQKYTGEPYGLRSGLAAFTVTPDRSWARNYSD